MKLLKVPEHYKDMTIQTSLTGVTILKESKFKARHGGSKIVVQKPREGLILKKNDLLEIERLKNCKPIRKKKNAITVEPIKPIKKIRKYSINKKEISHRIRNMVNQMQGEKKLFFWTITFPEGTSDDAAFICFNKWLTRCKRDLNLRSYLWVSERQKNKTIHFHIALHQRMCVNKANKFMRACLFTCIDNKEINYSRENAKNYNGVDIAKDRKTKRVTNFASKKKEKSLVNYLIKYVSKNDGEFKHLAYHCSRDYSNLITKFRLTETEYQSTNFDSYLDKSAPFENEWVYFYKWTKKPPDNVCRYLAFVNQIVIKLVTNN